MEGIVYLIVFAIVIYLLILLIRYVIIPALSIVAIVGAVAGGGIALFMYFRAAIEYLNPYKAPEHAKSRGASDVYQYRGKNLQENVRRRSYFFGPGFFSLWNTWKTSWIYNLGVVQAYWKWMNNVRDNIETDWLRYALTVIFWTGLITLCAAVLLIGSVVSIGVGLVHGAIMLAVMSVVYVVFSILYLVDHTYLWRHNIQTICPIDNTRYIVPAYRCSCNAVHTKLIPSPYGIWTHRCTCGAKLPATFFNGRSKLEALCPKCAARMASSSSKQFCVSLVGGSSSGKTTLIASYLHTVKRRLAERSITVTIPEEFEKKTDRLEQAYETAEALKGTVRTEYADPYTMILSGGGLEFSRQFNLFDVAGETFETPDLGGLTDYNSFAQSEAMMIVVDPLASAELRRQVEECGVSVATASTFDPSLVVNNLANYLRQTAAKTGERINRPTAVVITKTDLPIVEQEISSERLESEISQYPGNPADVRNRLCRAFLEKYGLSTLIMAIDANFSKVRYFTLSATGGAKPGESYRVDPQLEEPFNWLIRSSDAELANAMNIPAAAEEA